MRVSELTVFFPRLVFFCLFLFSVSGYSKDHSALADHSTWQALLHYWSGSKGPSEVYSDSFFLASSGKTDALAELQANLNFLENNPEQYACRFPARKQFICGHSPDTKGCTEVPTCPKLQKFLDAHRSERVVLGFGANYTGDPSSLYGHTFLWFVPPELEHYEKTSTGKVLSYDTDLRGMSAFEYVPQAFFANLKGRYASQDFHQRERIYRFEEHRDIWFFPLRASEAERQRILLHAFELMSVELAYGFTTRNCALRLMELIQVAYPDYELVSGTLVSPAETLKVLNEKSLIDSSWVRPSRLDVYTTAYDALSDEEKKEAENIFWGWDGSGEPSVKLLELALLKFEIDYPYSTFLPANPGESLEKAAAREHHKLLLEKRMLYPSGSSLQEDFLTPLSNTSPLVTHGLIRLSFSQGLGNEQETFTQIGFRLALHDYNDSPRGYPEDIELLMGQIEGKYRYRAQDFELKKITIVRVGSRPNALKDYSSRAWTFALDSMDLPITRNRFQKHSGLGAELGIAMRLGSSIFRWEQFVYFGGRLGVSSLEKVAFVALAMGRVGWRFLIAQRGVLTVEAKLVLTSVNPERPGWLAHAIYRQDLSQSLALFVHGERSHREYAARAGIDFYF